MIEGDVWLDGELVPAAAVTVPLMAQSLQRGTLVFDVFDVVHRDGAVHGLGAREHVERFVRSAELTGMELERSVDELLEACRTVAVASPGARFVRLCAWFNGESMVLVPAPGDVPRIAVFALPGAPVDPDPAPARIQVARIQKIPPGALSPEAKVAASYASGATATIAARREGYDDIVLTDGEGHLTESTVMSLVLVVGGVLRSARTDTVLDGITRRVVLDVAADEGIAVELGPLPLELLDEASEAFLCSTSWFVRSISELGPRRFDAPGPVTARLAGRVHAIAAGTDRLSGRWCPPL